MNSISTVITKEEVELYYEHWDEAVKYANVGMVSEEQYWQQLYCIWKDKLWKGINPDWHIQEDWVQHLTSLTREEGGCKRSTLFQKMTALERAEQVGILLEHSTKAMVAAPEAMNELSNLIKSKHGKMDAEEVRQVVQDLPGLSSDEALRRVNDLGRRPDTYIASVEQLINDKWVLVEKGIPKSENLRIRVITYSWTKDSDGEHQEVDDRYVELRWADEDFLKWALPRLGYRL